MADGLYRIGIIGAGTIAQAIIKDVAQSGIASIDYILTARPGRELPVDLPGTAWLTDPDQALARPVDLVVEAAVPDVLARHAPAILHQSDLCGFSCTAWADPALEDMVRSLSAQKRFRCYVPHGAVLGLDGLADGRGVIDSVVVTTTKSGRSMGLAADASGVAFEGTARGACRRFPRNVNVHAAIALAGIGFDRTRSRIIAVPDLPSMEHRIEVSGPGLAWEIKVSSQSLGGVTGSYTPMSAIGSIRRIIENRAFAIA
jgi:aspartate dehydrogenase